MHDTKLDAGSDGRSRSRDGLRRTSRRDRRTFLQALGAAGMVGGAGCLAGLGEDDSSDDTDDGAGKAAFVVSITDAYAER